MMQLGKGMFVKILELYLWQFCDIYSTNLQEVSVGVGRLAGEDEVCKREKKSQFQFCIYCSTWFSSKVTRNDVEEFPFPGDFLISKRMLSKIVKLPPHITQYVHSPE